MKTLGSREEISTSVESLLIQYCQTNIDEAKLIGPGYVQLWQEILDLVEAGGKRIRPYLVCLAYGSYGGGDKTNILQVASAWEILHICLLIHDDIIDRDTVRHNKLNIAGNYQKKYEKLISKDSEHYSMSAALLAGDLMLLSAYDIVNSSAISSENKLQVQKYLRQAFFSSGGGELMDIESAFYPIQESSPAAIAHYKTAVYSFQLPMVCGARVAGASEEELKKLDSIGLEVGIAFQLRDDLLGVFGTEDKTGKSNRSDIYEKKRTMLIVEAQKALSAEKAECLEVLFDVNRPINSEEVEEVVELIKESGAINTVEQEIKDRTVRARLVVQSLKVAEEFKNENIRLIDKIEVRKF